MPVMAADAHPPAPPAPIRASSDSETLHALAAPSSEEFRSSVFRGLAWQTVLVVTDQVTRIATGLVLVRLLEPRDYGLAGMALVFSSFVLVFSDLGLGA